MIIRHCWDFTTIHEQYNICIHQKCLHLAPYGLMVNMQDSDSWAPSSILGGILVFYGYQSYFTQTPTQKIHSKNMQK